MPETSKPSRGGDVSSPQPPSQPKAFWDETSQPRQLLRGRRRPDAVAPRCGTTPQIESAAAAAHSERVEG